MGRLQLGTLQPSSRRRGSDDVEPADHDRTPPCLVSPTARAPQGDAVRRPVALRSTGSGPLSGARLAVEEMVATEGVPMSANTSLSLAASAAAPGPDAEIVRRLRSAGASVVATTVCHELAWGITSWGRGDRLANPHLAGRITGGSSGGAASLVASGQAELAVGLETAGSCRIPAAWCGTWGWKVGPGVVPVDRVLPLAPGLDALGMVAVTGERLCSAVDVLGGERVDLDRIEVPMHLGPVEERAALALAAAAARCAAGGRPLIDHVSPLVDVPVAELLDLFTIVQSAAALQAHRDVLDTWPAQREWYEPDMAMRLAGAEQRSTGDLFAARARIARIRDHVLVRLDGAVALTVVTGCPPPTQRDPDHTVIGGVRRPLADVVLAPVVLTHLVGLPAVTIPWWIDGEPVGVQLLGPPGSDLALAELAVALGPRGDSSESVG